MDLRNEVEHIFNNGYAWYQRNLGEVVIWHEYDSRQSEFHPVYDEGGRHYTAGIVLPALWVIVTEARADRSPEGRKPTEKLAMAVSSRAMDMSGVSDPDDAKRHLNDVVRFDGKLWSVDEYNVRGGMPHPLILGITATQVFADEDMTFDDLPPDMELGEANRSMPYPNDSTSIFLEHDQPGEYADLYAAFDGDLIIDGGTASS